MNGFGFVEFEDEADARDIVPGIHFPRPFVTHLLTQR